MRIAEPTNKPLIAIQGLTITEKHPIRLGGQWVLPKNVPSGIRTFNLSGYVYCFVLEHTHVAMVNGIECVTWGHNLKGEVVEHEYYGTQKVVEDLMKMDGWTQGFVTV